MPRTRDGAVRNGEVWTSPRRESPRMPTVQPVRRQTSTANSQRYINDLGVGARTAKRQYGAFAGVSARGRISAERHNGPSSGWHLSLPTDGRVLGFQGPYHLHGAVSSFALNPLVGVPEREKNKTLLLKNEAERGWGTDDLPPRTDPQRGGGKPSRMAGFAPCPAHNHRKNPQTLAAQGIGGNLSHKRDAKSGKKCGKVLHLQQVSCKIDSTDETKTGRE